MKTISKTSNTSIIGVTLGSAFGIVLVRYVIERSVEWWPKLPSRVYRPMTEA